MKKHVLFIHGAGEGAYKEDKKLADSLQKSLGSSYEVVFPKMENEEDADYATWARQITGEVASVDDAVILVGHSVGASVLLKYLAENKIKNTITGIFLIAAPFWGGDKGWTYDGYKTLELPSKADTELPNDVPLFFYHSKDDETVPFAHLALFAERFPNAIVSELDGRGHQLNNDLSEVADDVKKLG